MTEDADLGFRLCRAGYRQTVINLPTLEDAPADLDTWIAQRTRWFKGWIQTWLVLMRNPWSAWRSMGTASFLCAQILLAGMVLSSLVHPFLILSLVTMIAALLALPPELGALAITLITLDLVNIALGYLAFIALGLISIMPEVRASFRARLLLVPVYWLLLSAAAWRAVVDIIRRPHYWAKTPHASAYVLPTPRPAA